MRYRATAGDKLHFSRGHPIHGTTTNFSMRSEQIDMNLMEAYDFASRVMVENMLKFDAEEGIDAFIEKRKPNWQDK